MGCVPKPSGSQIPLLPMNGAKKFPFALIMAFCSGVTPLVAHDNAHDPAVAQAIEAFRKLDQWDIQTFRLPTGYSFTPAGDLRDEAAATQSSVIKTALDAQVGNLPEGTSFLADLKSGTLVARSTYEGLQRIGYFCDQVCRHLPRVIAFKLEVFETNTAVGESLLGSLLTQQDHGTYAAELRGQVAKGEATLLAQLQGQGKSGSRVTLMQEHQGSVPALKFEVDPTLGPTDVVDLNLHFAVRDAPTGAAPGQVSQPEALLTTGDSVRSGTSRVLAMWKPWGQEKDVTRVAILTTHVNPMLPEKNDQLEKQVRDLHGTPATATSEIRIPDGMELRTMHRQVDLFALWDPLAGPGDRRETVPADPFENARQPSPVEKSPIGNAPPPIRPIEEGLKQQGIEFPPGSRIYLHRASSTLVVVNTPKNMDQIQAFTESFCNLRPVLLVHELLVVEGERALMQSLAAETERGTDHTRAWRRAQELLAKGELKRTGFVRSETRNGQRLLIFAGQSGGTPPTTSPGAGDDDVEDEEDENDSDSEEEETPLGMGTRLEADTIIGPDGYTMDVNVAFTQHQAQKGADPAVPPPSGSVLTSTTLPRGIPRLLYLWNTLDSLPAGKGTMQAAFLRVSRFDVNP
jgi:hypothetical protein